MFLKIPWRKRKKDMEKIRWEETKDMEFFMQLSILTTVREVGPHRDAFNARFEYMSLVLRVSESFSNKVVTC